MKENISAYKLVGDTAEAAENTYEVEFNVVMGDNIESEFDSEIRTALADIDSSILDYENQLSDITSQIDFYTSHVDKLDIIVSTCSGILTATLDAIWKEIRLKNAFGGSSEGKDLLDLFNAEGSNVINDFIEKLGDSENLQKAVEKSVESGNSKTSNTEIKDKTLQGLIVYLEDRFNIPGDSLTAIFGGSNQHHLRDFSHHPSLIGLVFSFITQFTMKCYGTDTKGNFISVPLEFIEGKEGRIAKRVNGKDVEIKIIGENIGEKITFATTIWFFHLVSDMAGSRQTPGAGMGLPGPIMSLAKEISALPIFKKVDENGNKQFSVWLSKLYNGTLLATRDENGKIIEKRKVDMRTEAGILSELKDQAIPVLLNEFIVRGFYFVRRFVAEIKQNEIHSFKDLSKINAEAVVPVKNRTIIRMLTVSTGAFTATNLAAAATVGATKSGGTLPAFAAQMVLRINFVGVGRFAVAIKSDVSGAISKSKLENEKLVVENKLLSLTCSKVYYLNAKALSELNKADSKLTDVFDEQNNMWTQAKEVNKAIFELMAVIEASLAEIFESCEDIEKSMDSIVKNVNRIDEANPGFKDELIKMLKI